jgi:hypothetical protein
VPLELREEVAEMKPLSGLDKTLCRGRLASFSSHSFRIDFALESNLTSRVSFVEYSGLGASLVKTCSLCT